MIAGAYVAAHLPSVAPSLEDVDSINFALGLRDFDPAQHQPHPPGYPVYMAVGRMLVAALTIVWPASDRIAAEALALGLLSAVSGALAIVAAAHLFRHIVDRTDGGHQSLAGWATAFLAAAPLFWMSGLRPMSDLPGLAAALAGQALALYGRTDRRRLIYAALVSGLAAGIRVQTLCLTVPLLALAVVEQRRAGWRWLVSRPMAALLAGGFTWAMPLLMLSGGMSGYVRALGSQAGEDFAWVNMLSRDPTPRRLAFALYETFVLPWGSIALAVVIIALAVAGAVITLARERRVLLILVLAGAPYTLFHLLFQETLTVRYALPTLPVVAWLAVRGISLARQFTPAVAGSVVAVSLVVAVPVGVAYGGEPHPAFRAIADAARIARTDVPAAVYSHFSLRRPLQAATGELPFVEPRPQYEWLGPVEYWRSGGSAPVWFLADPLRADLDLIDPRTRSNVVRYRWNVANRGELSGTRPRHADWYRLDPPGWFLGEGWSLTPETGGLARARDAGPDHRPIEGWVRRRPGPLHMVVGGRHLGDRGDPPAHFEMTFDGVVRDRWSVTVAERNFLRFLDLPRGVPSDDAPYARLTIAAHSGSGSRPIEAAVRQFDISSADEMVYGFGEGWHEEEYDALTGRRWRWTSERSVLRIKGPAQVVRIAIRGESPLRYYDNAPTLRITAAGRVIDEIRPDADFEWTVTVPAADVTRAEGAIVLEVDRVYLPAVAEGSTDDRRLGLRLFECRVSAVHR